MCLFWCRRISENYCIWLTSVSEGRIASIFSVKFIARRETYSRDYWNTHRCFAEHYKKILRTTVSPIVPSVNCWIIKHNEKQTANVSSINRRFWKPWSRSFHFVRNLRFYRFYYSGSTQRSHPCFHILYINTLKHLKLLLLQPDVRFTAFQAAVYYRKCSWDCNER